jgi:arylsulfatase A-like enzyme
VGSKKNILIILTDQQRKDSLGCYGNPVCETPNLDRLAAEGIRFERNYVANPICMPNRLSLFTGKNIRGHGLWTNGLLIPECQTLPGYFKDHGYQTANIGKIHFTPYGGEGGNFESTHFWRNQKNDFEWNGPYWGFEHVELTLGHTEPLAHYGKWFHENGGDNEMMKIQPVLGAMQSGTTNIPERLHDSSFVAERASHFLKNGRDPEKPFFMVASFPDPHHPFNPPAETAAKYQPDKVVMPVGDKEDLASRPEHYHQHLQGAWSRAGITPAGHPEGVSESHTRELISHTYAMVDLIDQNIGKILATLESEGLKDDTIVIFTSDHGELLGDHGLWFKGPFFYEGLLNTPLIISCPDKFKPGVSNTLFSDIDLAPTLCDWAELPPLPYMNGKFQMPHLIDRETEIRDRCLVEYRNGNGENDCSSKALITKDFKYVKYQTGEEELTDLNQDPSEKTNLTTHDNYQKIKARLRIELLEEILQTEPKGPAQIAHA